MLNRLVLVVIFVPLAVALVTLSVANRGLVPFTVDPFHPGNPALTLSLPFFVWLFLALGLGILIGGAITWLRQGFYRSLARRRGREADHLRQAARTQSGTGQSGTGAAARAEAAPLPALLKPAR